jgi:tetratricopeptide (TPR) repeat protein
MAFLDLAHLAGRQGDVAESKEAAERARRFFEELGDKRGAAWAVLHLAASAALEGEMERAVVLYDECGTLFRELDDDEGVAAYLNERSDLALRKADYALALELVEEAMMLRRRGGLHEGAVLLYNAALALLRLGRLTESEAAYRKGIERGQDLGDRSGLCLGLFGMASVLEQAGMLERSARLFGAAERLREEIGLSLTGAELADHDRLSSSLEARLGDGLSKLVVAGRELELDEAVAEALARSAQG